MQDWFVYYKLDAATAAEFAPRVRAMQRDIAAATGVRTRLMKRADGGAAATLLEIYERIAEPATFDDALSAALTRAELPAQLVAQRHTERFEEC